MTLPAFHSIPSKINPYFICNDQMLPHFSFWGDLWDCIPLAHGMRVDFLQCIVPLGQRNRCFWIWGPTGSCCSCRVTCTPVPPHWHWSCYCTFCQALLSVGDLEMACLLDAGWSVAWRVWTSWWVSGCLQETITILSWMWSKMKPYSTLPTWDLCSPVPRAYTQIIPCFLRFPLLNPSRASCSFASAICLPLLKSCLFTHWVHCSFSLNASSGGCRLVLNISAQCHFLQDRREQTWVRRLDNISAFL